MKQDTDLNYSFCLVGKVTNVGRVRKANEDSMDVFETANMKIFVVCDGMGGHVGGQMASQTAIAAIKDFLTNSITTDPREAIHNSIMAANEAIQNRARLQPELSGMGSTCVMLVVTSDGKVYYGHVGDSRIYIVANRRIIQLTKDHSFVQMLVDAGQITKEQAEHHPRKNEITNALGLKGMLSPTVCSSPIEPEAGNCFLLCSDGLTGMVDDTRIERTISDRKLKIQERAEKLVKCANDNGGVDNITVQLVEFALSAQDINSPVKAKKNQKKLLLYFLPIALFLAGIIALFLYKQTPLPVPINSDNKTNVAQKQEGNRAITLAKRTLSETEQDVVLVGESLLPANDSLISVEVNLEYKDYVEIIMPLTKYSFKIRQKNPMKAGIDKIKLTCETKIYKQCIVTIPIAKPIAGNNPTSIVETHIINKDGIVTKKKEIVTVVVSFKAEDDVDVASLRQEMPMIGNAPEINLKREKNKIVITFSGKDNKEVVLTGITKKGKRPCKVIVTITKPQENSPKEIKQLPTKEIPKETPSDTLKLPITQDIKDSITRPAEKEKKQHS